MRALVARPALFTPASRRAIIVRSDLGFGMARMYQIFRADEAGAVRVFKDLDGAKEWLRIR